MYEEVLTLNYYHSRFSPRLPKETLNGGFTAAVIISSLERIYPAGCFTRHISSDNNFIPSVPIVHASLMV
jgi:hypothetical protein